LPSAPTTTYGINGTTYGLFAHQRGGGLQFILSAGTVSGGTVISGASMTVSSGGVVLAGLTLSGGTANISGSMGAGQTMSFAGTGGQLTLYNLPAFGATISGFAAGDGIDLGGFAFSPAATHSFNSGTLTITSGAAHASLSLAGAYVTSDFVISSDGATGTRVKFT
jgi:hypothetical protein